MSMNVRRDLAVVPTSDKTRSTDRIRGTDLLIVVDSRNLARECFVRSLEMSHPRIIIRGYASAADWLAASPREPLPIAVLFNIGSGRPSDMAVRADLRHLVEAARPTPVIVLGETEDLCEMIEAVDSGAAGYIPASIGIDVVVEATRLTAAGGMFLPVASVLSLRDQVAPRALEPGVIDERFTARQAAVASALWRGKSNKIIAYELKMSESTVKVHIRNIMKKLKATNRTEAAFKLTSVFSQE
jgi:DNA-binding NarL/FixJ family response regulator